MTRDEFESFLFWASIFAILVGLLLSSRVKSRDELAPGFLGISFFGVAGAMNMIRIGEPIEIAVLMLLLSGVFFVAGLKRKAEASRPPSTSNRPANDQVEEAVDPTRGKP